MKLLLVGDSPALYSGQARMVRELTDRFYADGVDVVIAGWHHLMTTRRFDAPYQIYPASKSEPAQVFSILQRVQPDAVLAIGDPWEFSWLSQQRARGAPWLLYGYFNCEFSENPPHIEQTLDGFDDFRVTSQAGSDSLGRGERAVHLGVDLKMFKPGIRPARILGKELTPEHVVIFVNGQNRGRKNLGGCVAAIAELAKDCSRPLLAIFNTQSNDPYGTHLGVEVIRHDVQDIVVFNDGNYGPDRTVDDDVVAELYRAADLLLTMSFSEGFGLPVLEAMATNTLVVAPASYSMPELLGSAPFERGVLYRAGSKTNAGYMGLSGMNAWSTMPDVDDAADALARAITLLEEPAGSEILKRARDFAATKTWTATYQGISPMVARAERAPRWPVVGAKVADGGPMDPLLRWQGRQRADGRFGVVKMGGLGDMLMTTRVIHEMAKKTGQQAVVFCNSFTEIFAAMPEVADIVLCLPAPQADVVRSVADEYELLLDLRLPARAYGPKADPPTKLSQAFAWMTDGHVPSLQRLHTLKIHATRLMLESLGLPFGNIDPIYTFRAPASPDALELFTQAIIVAPGAGGLGKLKQPSKAWWETLVALVPHRKVIQVGAFDDPLITGAIDGRGWGISVTATAMAACHQIIAVESGLAHLARAVRADRPEAPKTVVLFGPTHLVSYSYAEHVNLSRGLCEPCFFSHPSWVDQICAMSAPTCLNLPEVEHVLRHLVP